MQGEKAVNPGWYRDPAGTGDLRWWSGQHWTGVIASSSSLTTPFVSRAHDMTGRLMTALTPLTVLPVVHPTICPVSFTPGVVTSHLPPVARATSLSFRRGLSDIAREPEHWDQLAERYQIRAASIHDCFVARWADERHSSLKVETSALLKNAWGEVGVEHFDPFWMVAGGALVPITLLGLAAQGHGPLTELWAYLAR